MVKVRVQHPPEASVKIHQVLKVTNKQSEGSVLSHWFSLSGFFFVPGVWIQSHPADALFLLVLGVGGSSGSRRWTGPSADAQRGRHVQPAGWVQVLLQRGQRQTGETETSVVPPAPSRGVQTQCESSAGVLVEFLIKVNSCLTTAGLLTCNKTCPFVLLEPFLVKVNQ